MDRLHENVVPGCDHCYAEAGQSDLAWFGGEATRVARDLGKLLEKSDQMECEARAFKREHGHRPRVFCASLADVFDNQAAPEWRHDLFALIRECRRLDWLMLTKRPQNITKMLPADWGDGYRNVWLGVTAENQTCFDRRWKHLQNIPAVIKFISLRTRTRAVAVAETQSFAGLANIGGESGGGARPLDPQWVRDVIADCRRRVSSGSTSSGAPIQVIRSSWSRA